jgi:ABC-type multidrug transport system ATPase subunit
MENNTSEGKISLAIRGVWIRKGHWPKHASIVRDACLEIEPGEFVAIVGPNGAGKTTLLRAVVGEEPYCGEIQLNGQHLYDDPEFWLPQIGYVPSDNVLHDDLRVREALKRVGQLRLPQASLAELKNKIETLLQKLGFPEARRNARIKRPNLSDGQRKRLNICAELLTEPQLLVLDEPTSGLDPHGESGMMQQLRSLAESEGLTVLAVVHTSDWEVLKECHRIVFMARGGVVVWQGPPDEMPEWAQKVVGPTAGDSWWAALFEHYGGDWERADDDGTAEKIKPPRPSHRSRAERREQSAPTRHQFRVLLRRYWSIMRGNPLSLALNVLIGALGGLLLFVLQPNAFIHNPDEVFSRDIGDARNAIFMVALVVVLIGLIGSFREIAKESHIYHHERLKGLSPWAYLLSKWVLLSALVGVLAPVLLMVTLVFVHHQDLPTQGVLLAARPAWAIELSRLVPAQLRSLALTLQVEGLLTFVLACMASLTLGLTISAFSSNQNTGTVLLALVVIVQLVLSGLMQNENMQDLIERLSVLVTSRWAIEGLSTSFSLYCWANPQFRDYYSLGHLGAIWLFLVVYILVAVALAYVALRLKEPFFSKLEALRNSLASKGLLMALALAVCLGSWGHFLKVRAQEYYSLRTERDVRIEDVASKSLYQTLLGHVSQSQCPTPTLVPPPVAPIVAIPPESQVEEPSPTATGAGPSPTTTATPVEPATPTIQAAPSATATPSPTPQALDSLPRGQVNVDTKLQYGPEHTDYPLASVLKGASFVLLGKDESQSWYRVKLQDSGLVGWLRADVTGLQPKLTNLVAAPPKCAQPRTFLVGTQSPNLAQWTSDVGGHVAAVVDLYREQAGEQFPAVTLQLKVGGQVVKNMLIPTTRQAFLLRGATTGTDVKTGDSLEFSLDGMPAGQKIPACSVTIFFVPDRCNFGND